MRATKKDILSAAHQIGRTGQTFGAERVITILRVWGLVVCALDQVEHVEHAIMSSDLYCTNESGLFAAL